ncbi:MAG: glycerophosphodiester phosphodiesterase [Sandaracinaceae bacterium]
MTTTSRYLPHGPAAFAHRGGLAVWPENTLVAFEGAIALGYRYIETDLHMTRDGAIVCAHDPTLMRCTDGAGRVFDLTLDELRTLDAGYRFTADGGETHPFRGKGVTIPTLEEALALHPELKLNVEIKQREPAMEAALWDEIERLDAHDRLLVAAEQDSLVHRFRGLRGTSMPTSPGTRGVARFWLGVRSGLHRFDRYPFDALQVPVHFQGIPIVTPAFIEAAHGHGIQVHVWTINDTDEMHRLLELGVDVLMTDYPARLADVFHARGLALDGGTA